MGNVQPLLRGIPAFAGMTVDPVMPSLLRWIPGPCPGPRSRVRQNDGVCCLAVTITLDSRAGWFSKEGQASFPLGYLKSSQSLNGPFVFSDATNGLRILDPVSLTSDTGSDATSGLTDN